ncbi:MAG: porin family protein [Ferruginibacter sp.]
MKRSLILLTAILLSVGLKAQLFYVQGGVNFANITTTTDGRTENNNMLTSFNAGLMGRFGLSNTIDLETGLILNGQGSKAETYFNGGNDYVKSSFNPIYIQLPLNAVLKIPLQKKSGLFINAGPYIAVGVAGKSKVDTKLGIISSSSESKIQFSNDDPFTSQQDDASYNKLKRFDFGLNAGGGFDFGKIILKANYGIGLAKINSTQSDNNINDKNKYRTLSVSLGIPLGR